MLPPLRIFLLIVICATVSLAEDSSRKIAYEKNSRIFVSNLEGSDAKNVGAGVFPNISPDGKRVAFNTEEENGKKFVRHIAVVDIESGKTNLFKNVPSENVYYPKWAPDGSQIVFTLYDGHVWHLVLINPDGTDFRYLRKAKDKDVTLYSPAWASDGKSVFVQDMTNIYRLGLDGVGIARWEIKASIPTGDMSGDGRIEVAPDGKRLLLGIDMNEEAHRKTWDGPLPALWIFDIESKKATRVTSKKLFGWDGCWVDNSSILFLSQAANEKDASLYSMPLAGGKPKLIVQGVRDPSVSR